MNPIVMMHSNALMWTRMWYESCTFPERVKESSWSCPVINYQLATDQFEITQMGHPHPRDWGEDHVSRCSPSTNSAKAARRPDSADHVEAHGVKERDNWSKCQID